MCVSDICLSTGWQDSGRSREWLIKMWITSRSAGEPPGLLNTRLGGLSGVMGSFTLDWSSSAWESGVIPHTSGSSQHGRAAGQWIQTLPWTHWQACSRYMLQETVKRAVMNCSVAGCFQFNCTMRAHVKGIFYILHMTLRASCALQSVHIMICTQNMHLYCFLETCSISSIVACMYPSKLHVHTMCVTQTTSGQLTHWLYDWPTSFH